MKRIMKNPFVTEPPVGTAICLSYITKTTKYNTVYFKADDYWWATDSSHVYKWSEMVDIIKEADTGYVD